MVVRVAVASGFVVASCCFVIVASRCFGVESFVLLCHVVLLSCHVVLLLCHVVLLMHHVVLLLRHVLLLCLVLLHHGVLLLHHGVGCLLFTIVALQFCYCCCSLFGHVVLGVIVASVCCSCSSMVSLVFVIVASV